MSGINSSRKTTDTRPSVGTRATTDAASTVAANPTTGNNTSSGMLRVFDSFADPLRNMMNGLIPGRNETYNELDMLNKRYQWLKEVYDQLKQSVPPGALLWEGPGKITGWPTDVDQAIAATNALEAGLNAAGIKLDLSYRDKVTYVDPSGTRVVLDKNIAYANGEPRAFERQKFFADNHILSWDAKRNWSNADLIASYWNPPVYVKFPDGNSYWVTTVPKEGSPGYSKSYITSVSTFTGDPSQLSLQLYGDAYAAETSRLVDAGLPVSQYDGYQYSINGKTAYTAVNQTLSRDTAVFDGIPNGTIVAVKGANGDDYYLVNYGRGQKLDGRPKGILMGLPSNLVPQDNQRYTNAIVDTLSLVQGDSSFKAGDYDMGMYFYGGGQVGYAKMPPVVINVDPQKTNTVSYPPGTLLQYTDEQNKVGYYRVTGTGVAKVEDPSNFAKAVKGNPPDLASVDPGTVVKLDHGKLYWVTSDKKIVPAEGAPLLRFMSPEQKARFDGVRMTEALQEAGMTLSDRDTDAVRFKDQSGNTIIAKLPTKIFNGPGTEPRASDYTPGDVIENTDKSEAWYIDAKGSVQKAQSCIELKASNVKAADFDPKNYNPGDVVGLDDGRYFRITIDHEKVQISYPLQKFILNPSREQIASLQGKLIDMQNSSSSNMNRLTLKLQDLQAQNNTLATLFANLIKAIQELLSKPIAAMA